MSNNGNGPNQQGGNIPPHQLSIAAAAFETHLRRWYEEVFSLERRGMDAEKTAQDFAKLALTSALLMNGGALVALPAAMQWLNPTGRALVPNIAMWFPIGLLSTVGAITLAYINWMMLKAAYFWLAHKRGCELDAMYQNKKPEDDPKYAKAIRAHGRCNTTVIATQYGGIVCAMVAYACFGIGIFGFLTLAQYQAPLPPTPVVAPH